MSPLAWGVDRNGWSVILGAGAEGRPSRGGVDRNLSSRLVNTAAGCRPSRGGVDRNCARGRLTGLREVAPRVGAWIETLNSRVTVTSPKSSPLAWGRGSKPLLSVPLRSSPLSPLAWGRGSKPLIAVIFAAGSVVAPRVGAWIETMDRSRGTRSNLSPLAWGRGSKHLRSGY